MTNKDRQEKYRQRNDPRLPGVMVECRCPTCKKMHLVEYGLPQKITPSIYCKDHEHNRSRFDPQYDTGLNKRDFEDWT
jgi:hypothetical protein